MVGQPSIWELRVGIYASAEDARALVDQIAALLCPDDVHPGPCPVPWSIDLLRDTDLPAGLHDGLVEQYRVERQ
ncbi:hypothetical protein [Micromonospora sp. NPDC005205]|uniref:hypothetical protein n=1 Tax=Micromonospora sp. NPDC005205 TaxID=3156714 RepID=UPI0033BC73EF